MSAEIRIGASGFSYKEWLGGFYPAKLPGAKMLAYYAERLSTVEINYTFRAMPKRSMLEGWAAKTPAHFRFALKAPQRITHFARLRGASEALDYFVETASALGERLGQVLFQLPPDLECDNGLLTEFLDQVDGRVRAAFEFRHRSWFGEDTMRTLRDRGAALCVAESDKLSSPIERTAPHVYMRLRKERYNDDELEAWARRIRELAQGATEVCAYFKHEAAAPDLAARLQRMLSG
ncbi:MAG TPA: DUF72 domain-containing protein [Candidatus Binataceae bacterium]|nr:DUF72 domain-containing protein [Candidatus Binataceae bacterium]